MDVLHGPKLIMASRFTSRFHSSQRVQHHSRVFMISRYFVAAYREGMG